MQVKEISIKDLKKDKRNANKGNPKGNEKLSKSIEELGLGRGILIDKDNNIIAGNHVFEEAKKQGYDKAIIVPTDGKTLVITQRTDVEIDSKLGRELAIADNVTAKEGIEFDMDIVGDLMKDFDLDMDFMPDVNFEISNNYEGYENEGTKDYSEKNKELELSDFDNSKMIIKLEYTEEDYWKVKEQLSKIAQTPEQAIWQLLGNE